VLLKYRNFLRGLAVTWWGKIGVILTTSSFITFILFETAQTVGLIRNAYIGLITYLLFPALFVIGLVLIPLGWYKYRKLRGLSTKRLLEEKFSSDDVQARSFGSRVFLTVMLFTLINVVFITTAGLRMLHFMDQANFCGTACHTVMNPEWVTYQQSPHARVKCVECHVGEGIGALIDSKINGTRQMILATFHAYSTPIPTPVHQLRPARETCEKCHWPEKFYGRIIRTHVHYRPDSLSTPLYNTLILKIDASSGEERAGIHWHIGAHNTVRFTSVDDEQEEMITVAVMQNDSTWKNFTNKRLANRAENFDKTRTMDCVDCHNRATHIYQDPEKAIDELIRFGKIDRNLPFIKREALAAVTNNYPSQAAAMQGIEQHLNSFYLRQNPQPAQQWQTELNNAIVELQNMYNRNIHHQMKIEWGTYPSHLNHANGGGCFRCHNQNMQAEDGTFIRNECTLCHSFLAYEEQQPFRYLTPVTKDQPGYAMYEYLLQDALNSW
jgi:hypothetical protein